MKNKYLHTLPGILFLLFIIYFFINITGIQKVISWDALGYYLYLPSTFLYDDLALDKYDLYDQLIKKYDLSGTFYQINKTSINHYINKYSMGMSICYAPFYFIGDLVALLTDYPRDGFSKPYQLSLQIGGFIYTTLSVLMIYKILGRFYKKNVIAIVTAAFFFGTNYLITTTSGNSMPHNILFLFYGIVIWQTILWHQTHKTKNIIFLGIALGILTLSRPSEIVILIIPLLWNVTSISSFKQKIQLFKTYKIQLALLFVMLLCFGIPQFMYWKILAGKWLVTDYGNAAEGFDILSPHLIDVLFSFRKGWFIYTPIMLVATVGFYYFKKRNPKLFTPFFIFFILNLYIVSSWSCWWYAASFSCRALVQSSIVMLFPLAELVSHMLESKKKYLILSILSCFVVLNLFQSWQFNKGIIHNSRMTKEAYFDVFGAIKKVPNIEKSLLIKRNIDGSKEVLPKLEDLILTQSFKFNFEDIEDANENNKSGYLGTMGDYVNDKRAFSKAIKIPYSKITDQHHAWIEVNFKIQPTYNLKAEPFSLITLFDHKGKNYKYRGKNSEGLPLKVGEWNSMKIVYLTPEVRSKDDQFVFYIWNRGKQLVRIDDVEIKVFENK